MLLDLILRGESVVKFEKEEHLIHKYGNNTIMNEKRGLK